MFRGHPKRTIKNTRSGRGKRKERRATNPCSNNDLLISAHHIWRASHRQEICFFNCTAIDARQNVGSTKMNPSPKATLRKWKMQDATGTHLHVAILSVAIFSVRREVETSRNIWCPTHQLDNLIFWWRHQSNNSKMKLAVQELQKKTVLRKGR